MKSNTKKVEMFDIKDVKFDGNGWRETLALVLLLSGRW